MLTAITIVKTIIGSSILIVPYTINQLGYFFGTIIFLSALAINQFGTLLLLKAKNLSGHSNYATIFFSIWNSNLSRAIGFLLIFLNNVGFCTYLHTQASPKPSFSNRPSGRSSKIPSPTLRFWTPSTPSPTSWPSSLLQ